MHGYISFILSFCFLIFFGSCKVKKSSVQKTSNKKEQVLVIQSPKKELEVYPYRPSQTLKNDLIHTILHVSFNWQKQHLNGIAILKFKPYFYPQDSLILDAKGMDIHEVGLINSTSLKKDPHYDSEKPSDLLLKYKYDSKKLRIKLDRTYFKTDSFEVRVKYTAKPNDLPKGGSQAITSDIGLYFINPLGEDPDKPRQIWTQGETEASSCWFPTIDTPNEKTTQEMFITVDSKFSMLSNGSFLGSKQNADGTKTNHWKQNLPHAPYLFMMAIGEFAVVNDHWKKMEVNYYVEPKFEKYAKQIFGNTPEMIQFFSDRLGYNYPWDKYSQVVVRDYVSGAMENTTATIFMEALQVDDRALVDENWDYIIAHELFHHWFGDLVTCESWSNLPLNESFANYSEYLWAEHKFGLDEADYHGEKETEEYFEEALVKQVDLIRFHYKDREDMFDRHSYNKGGRILHMLRKYVGDDAFFASLKLYLEKNQFTPVEVHDLRLAFEKITGEDLNWFFNQWFLDSGHPELDVNHNYSNGILNLTVKQTQDSSKTPIYKLPLNVDVWVNGIKNTYPIIIAKNNQEFQFPLLAAPNLVLFDSESQLLGIVNHPKTQEELIFQYDNYDKYLIRKNALSQMFTTKGNQPDLIVGQNINQLENPFENPPAKLALSKALKDPFWAIRLFALDQFSIYPISDIEQYLEIIENIASSDPKPSVRAKAISFLSAYSPKGYINIFVNGMKEKSYSVAGASLAAYLKSGDTTVQINYVEWEAINNISVILPLASYYLKSGIVGKYQWMKNNLKNGSPRIVYNLIQYFANYSKNVEPLMKTDAITVLGDISKNNKYEPIRIMAEKYHDQLVEKTKE